MDTESCQSLFLFVNIIGTDSFSSGFFIGLLLIFLFLLSGMISASEVAYFSLSQSQIEKLNLGKNRLNSMILNQLKTPDRLLATILIGSNFVNVAIVVLSTYVTVSLFMFLHPIWIAFLVQIVIVASLLIIMSEILPKIFINRYSLRIARFTVPVLILFDKIFWPLSRLLIYSTSIINKKLSRYSRNLSIDDLSEAFELKESNLNEEKNILKGIVKFGDIDVCEIMQPRVDMVAAEINISYDALLNIIEESGYSRIPVFEETFDHIKGILYIKDLLPHLAEPSNFLWQSLIRPSYYVPESKKINDLLKEFQVNHIHMAIVVDEYGGTSGIITLEDILEEIVGEITDESDEDELTYERIDANTVIFEGKTLLNDFFKVIEVDDTIFDEVKGDADTLAGLILEIRGEIPKVDDKINYRNFLFSIISVDKRRIKKIKVTIN